MRREYDLSTASEGIDEYTLVEKIGSGGFKDVFLANRDGGEQVVVKLLPVDRTQRRKRAEREADAMERISSDIFVDLLDHYETVVDETDTYVLVEEFIDGPTLKEIISSGDFGITLGLSVISAILDVLPELDENGLIHRDIKPSNIMVDATENIRLLDVGIVRFEERESLTPNHASRGPATPQYAAPEQLNNDKEAQGVRTDIFSSGIVLFEAISGEHPFEVPGKSKTEAIVDGDKRDLDGYIRDQGGSAEFAEELQFFFDIITQPEPHLRYRKPEFAMEQLQEILEGTNWGN